MMAGEQLKPADIDKLRALVGIGAEAAEHPEEDAQQAALSQATGDIQEAAGGSRFGGSVPVNESSEGQFQEHSSAETELFVKVDEHAAIGEILAGSKGSMKSIADTVSLLAKAEKLKTEAIDRMEVILSGIDDQIALVESKLVAPEGLSAPELGAGAAVEEDLINLRSELESLRGELGRMQK